MALTFQLPVPDRALSPNGRAHRAVKWKAASKARSVAKAEAERVLADAKMKEPYWKKAKYTAVLFMAGRMMRQDPDNFIATLKPYIDGIADAGIVYNDRDLWPERPEFRKVERMPRVEITITPEE